MKMKETVIMLGLMTILTSFMYFFVQCSIDKNIRNFEILMYQEKASELLTALNSNAVLARTFLFCFIVITVFIYYMFYNRFFYESRQKIGCFQALGFEKKNLVYMYIFMTFLLSVISCVIGMVLGYMASDILIQNYQLSYQIQGLGKEIGITSFFLGVCVPVIILCIITAISCREFYKKEISYLINNLNTASSKKYICKFSNFIAGFFNEKHAYSVRIALRKPVSMFLTIISVLIFSTLFIFSISLNLSSSKIFDSQLKNRFYDFDYRFETLQENTNYEKESCYLYVDTKVELKNGESLKQHIIGFFENNGFFILTDRKGIEITTIPDNQIVINPRFSEIYRKKEGDEIVIVINGKRYNLEIFKIADNADLNTLYMNQKNLSSICNIQEHSYNGIWSKEALNLLNANMITKEERIAGLEENNVSNRISAVICQVLAVIVGCLLIFMALLINFQSNTANVVKLNILGYQPREINTMLISVYRPVIIAGFLLTLYPAILLCRTILRLLSIETGDYMPFVTNISILFLTFIMVNCLYSFVICYFRRKIRRILKQDQTVFYYL